MVNTARVSFAGKGFWHELPEDYKNDPNALIRYLADHKHTTPFRHNSFSLRCKAPIFIARQLGKHQAGLCLHGDTKVTCIRHHKGASNKKVHYTLADLFKMWTGQVKYQGGLKGKMNVQAHRVRVYNEDTRRFETSKILDVIDSGVKQMYKITDEAGNSIEASKDHKFLTIDGWKTLNTLQVGDFLIRDDVGESFGAAEPLPRGLDKAARNAFRKSSEPLCVRCGSAESLEVDHVISVAQDISLAKDFGNMQILCKRCHTQKSISEKVSTTSLLPKMIPIVEIVATKEVQCYDLSIDKIHNFMGNGFIVHNSWNEVSRRYVDTGFDFYSPDAWRGRPGGSLKQGSIGPLSDELQEEANNIHWLNIAQAEAAYDALIKIGVAPEQARMELPQGMIVEFIWTGNLMAFSHVFNLRIEEHAQAEAQEFARELDKAIGGIMPVSWEALTSKQIP